VRNETSIKAVRTSELKSSRGRLLRLPLYESYCFSNIPNLIFNLLSDRAPSGQHLPSSINSGEVRHSPLLSCVPEAKISKLHEGQLCGTATIFCGLIDSFGWRFIEELYDEIPCLKTLESEGILSLLTSQFPSTTTAHVTTMNTGLPVYEHGLYEWFIYEPELDEVICPLLFSELIPLERGSLNVKRGYSAKQAFRIDGLNLYQRLELLGVGSYLVQPAEYAPSFFDDELCRGAHSLRYSNLSDAFSMIKKLILSPGIKVMGEPDSGLRNQYIYFYYGLIDSVAHEYGPLSKEHREACSYFFKTFEKELLPTLSGAAHCLSIMTADHGQKKVSPAKTLYIDEVFPELMTYLKKNLDNRLIAPVGSPVDLFLHLSDESREQMPSKVLNILSNISEFADIFTRQQLIERGLFGRSQSELFLSRIGDILLLSDKDNSIWLRAGSEKKVNIGQHGGLSPEEMEIPLFCF